MTNWPLKSCFGRELKPATRNILQLDVIAYLAFAIWCIILDSDAYCPQTTFLLLLHVFSCIFAAFILFRTMNFEEPQLVKLNAMYKILVSFYLTLINFVELVTIFHVWSSDYMTLNYSDDKSGLTAWGFIMSVTESIYFVLGQYFALVMYSYTMTSSENLVENQQV